MERRIVASWLGLGLAAIVSLSGCKKQSPPAVTPAPTGPAASTPAAPAPGPAPAPMVQTPPLGVENPPMRTPSTVRIATYNLLNLFDDKDDPNLSGSIEDLDSAKPESERRALASAIEKLDADIIAVQEIESTEALVEFRDQYLEGLGYEFAMSIGPGDDRGIEQGILSRFPVIDIQSWDEMDLGGVHPELFNGRPNRYAGEPLKTRRSPLAVTVMVPEETTGGAPYLLTMFVVHHKSGRGNEYWREAEARAFMQLIDEFASQSEGRNIVLLGDFNATLADESVKMYTDSGLRCVVEHFAAPGMDDPNARISHESGRAIDYILVNDNLAAEVIPGTAFILSTPLRPVGSDWRTTPTPPGYASDHLPVAVDIVPRDG